jgi:hypothetical protein
MSYICHVLQLHAAGVPRINHIRKASMNDVLSDVSSTRTTVFSKQTSITAKSSYSSLSVKSSGCLKLIDALDLETGGRKDGDSGFKYAYDTRMFSLGSAHITPGGMSRIEENVGSARDIALLGTTTAPRLLLHSNETIGTQLHHIDNNIPSMRGGRSSTNLDIEGIAGTHGDEQVSHRRKWSNKLFRAARKIDAKARGFAQATNMFGLTLRAFVR